MSEQNPENGIGEHGEHDDNGNGVDAIEPNGRALERIILAELAELSDGLADLNSRLRRGNDGQGSGGGGGSGGSRGRLTWAVLAALAFLTVSGIGQLYFIMRGVDDTQTSAIKEIEKRVVAIESRAAIMDREMFIVLDRMTAAEREVRELREARLMERAEKAVRGK